MKIDLELFRTFKAVFEIGTISGAARVLEVTQPSVTGHLKALEAIRRASSVRKEVHVT